MADFMADWLKSELERRSVSKVKLAELCKTLVALKITTVSIEYDGYGDSGEINLLSANDEDGNVVEISKETEDQLIDLLDVHLPEGWEINEGSQGEITVNIPQNKVTIEHQERVVETVESTIEVNL